MPQGPGVPGGLGGPGGKGVQHGLLGPLISGRPESVRKIGRKGKMGKSE